MKAILLGATGLVGGHLLTKLLQEEKFTQVIIFVRREMDIKHPKLRQIISNLEDLESYPQEFSHAETLFCCLGTTIKKAGSEEAFKKVDYTYPLKTANFFKEQNGKHFIVITALGSNSESLFFYNKTKGDLEKELKKLNLPELSIVRPSLILGERKEARLMEDVSKLILPLVNPLIPPTYRAVEAEEIAETMLKLGVHGYCKNDIQVERNQNCSTINSTREV